MIAVLFSELRIVICILYSLLYCCSYAVLISLAESPKLITSTWKKVLDIVYMEFGIGVASMLDMEQKQLVDEFD